MSTPLESGAGTGTGAAAGIVIQGGLTADAGPVVSRENVTVQGDVAPGAEIRAMGSVRVGGEITAANVICAGELHVPEGAIAGGRASAYRGVLCRTAGDRSGSPTEIVLGFDDQLMEAAEQRAQVIGTDLRTARQFHARLTSLLKAQRQLDAVQKERITELLYRATEGEKRAARAIVQWTHRLEQMDAHSAAQCLVAEVLHAGVILRFPGARLEITSPLQGPIRIFSVPSGNGVKIRASEPGSQPSHVMESIAETGRVETLRAALGMMSQG